MTAGEWPMTDESVEKLREIVRTVEALDEATGGWTMKCDARQTGMSLYFTWAKKVDVTTTLQYANATENAPGLLMDACNRLIKAHEAAGERP